MATEFHEPDDYVPHGLDGCTCDAEGEDPHCQHHGYEAFIRRQRQQLAEAMKDLGMAVDLLNHARCTDLGTDDKSWWRTQRDRIAKKWGTPS